MTERLVFTSEEHESVLEPIDLSIDDLDITAHPPKIVAWAEYMQALSGHGRDSFFACMKFLDMCLDPGDQVVLERRFRDRNDSLDLGTILKVVNALQEQWGPHLDREADALLGNREERRNAARAKAPADRLPAKRTQARKTTART